MKKNDPTTFGAILLPTCAFQAQPSTHHAHDSVSFSQGLACEWHSHQQVQPYSPVRDIDPNPHKGETTSVTKSTLFIRRGCQRSYCTLFIHTALPWRPLVHFWLFRHTPTHCMPWFVFALRAMVAMITGLSQQSHRRDRCC